MSKGAISDYTPIDIIINGYMVVARGRNIEVGIWNF